MGRYAYSERGRGRRRRGGCLPAFFAFAFVFALAVLVYALVVRPMITRAVVTEIVGAPPTLMPAGTGPGTAEGAVLGQAEAVLPTAVAALPAGEIVVSEAEVNGFLAARPEAIAPLDTVSMRFTPGTVVAQIGAYGVSSEARIGLAAQEGQIIVTGVEVDPPLSYVLSGQDLAGALAARLNAELATQSRSIEDLRVEQGQIVLVMS